VTCPAILSDVTFRRAGRPCEARRMAHIERFLIDKGYRDIAIVTSHWWENKSGYQPEYEDSEAVARKPDGAPHRIQLHWSSDSGPRIQSEAAISEADFLAAVDTSESHGFVDNADARAKYEAEKRDAVERQQRTRDAQKAFEQMRPLCPQCGARATLRNGVTGHFWGCPKFPRCRGTISINLAEWQTLEPLVKDGAG